VTNALLPLILKGQEKKIVHISTGMADTDLVLKSGVSYAVPYSASKAALNLVVAKYAAELG
jgi:NAD(P)-dependent dehydrogenase (short-subunit alcohol dehydrogenase family)